MGSPIAQVAQPMTQQSQGKGAQSSQPAQQVAAPEDMTSVMGGQNGQAQPMGKGGRVTFPSQGGQPQMGRPNNYSNTVGGWDNASIQPRQTQSGKGKGY